MPWQHHVTVKGHGRVEGFGRMKGGRLLPAMRTDVLLRFQPALLPEMVSIDCLWG